MTTEIAIFTQHLKLRDLKRNFCQHCMDSGLVNPELSETDRNLLLQQHWEKFWTGLSKHCSLIPMRVKKRDKEAVIFDRDDAFYKEIKK